jgi:hypothetical protein
LTNRQLLGILQVTIGILELFFGSLELIQEKQKIQPWGCKHFKESFYEKHF